MERRKAKRIPTNLVVRVQTAEGPVTASLQDISRRGLRLAVPSAILDVHALSTAGEVERAAATYFGGPFDVEFNPQDPKRVVRKRVAAVHLVRALVAEGVVELGCEFEDWLTDVQAHALGVVVPARSARIHIHGEAI